MEARVRNRSPPVITHGFGGSASRKAGEPIIDAADSEADWLLNSDPHGVSSDMDTLRSVPADFFSDLVGDAGIEAAMLLKRNGRMLAAWSRAPVSWDVVSIMAATTVGSLETMLETLRSPSPQSLSIVAAGNRIYIQKVEPQGLLVFVAKENVAELHLKDTARRLLRKLPSPPETQRRVTLGPNTH